MSASKIAESIVLLERVYESMLRDDTDSARRGAIFETLEKLRPLAAEPDPQGRWQWFGHPGHFICARDCRFHLCTLVGDHLVSTVGEYLPDESVREILAESRGVRLEGKGDDRRHDYMQKVGFEEIGYQRTYETMVFRVTGEVCSAPDCRCGLPLIDGTELDFRGYNSAGDATSGHMELCEKWAQCAPRLRGAGAGADAGGWVDG